MTDKLSEIKRLYYQTRRSTIKQDLSRAIEILKSMASEEERERAAAYMDGLSQLRSEWSFQTRGNGPQAGVRDSKRKKKPRR